MDLCNPKEIKAVMSAFGIAPRKEYGQNFLINRAALEDIADFCADDPQTFVLEIGPGLGALTRALSERYEKVAALEIDKGLIPLLGYTLGGCDNVSVINEDVMKADLTAIIKEYSDGMPTCVCANLPYYITTPILMRLLECGADFKAITIMIQAEVAARLTAKPGSADYGAITVVLEYYGDCKKVLSVSSGSFLPAPKVNSAVVKIELREEKKYKPKSEELFFKLIRAAFEQRRKTLANAISHSFPQLDKEMITSVIEACGHRPDIRGEKLSCLEFCRLSDALNPYMVMKGL
jgi:16S rRNA (adenine1518-N6/adenine1519-N6)-dimethyltransferase